MSTGFCGTSSTGEVPRFPLHNSNQDALKNATTFDLGVSAFRLPPPTWLVNFFWGGEDVVGVLFHYVLQTRKQKRSSVIVASFSL